MYKKKQTGDTQKNVERRKRQPLMGIVEIFLYRPD
jgi:hypothetical protein